MSNTLTFVSIFAYPDLSLTTNYRPNFSFIHEKVLTVSHANSFSNPNLLLRKHQLPSVSDDQCRRKRTSYERPDFPCFKLEHLAPLGVLPLVKDLAPLILGTPHLSSGNQTRSLTHELRGLDHVFSEYLAAGSTQDGCFIW